MSSRAFPAAVIIVFVAGCASYFSDDSVTIEGVDKRSAGGYERHAGRPTRIDDKFYQVSIGYKRLTTYGSDTRKAAEAESRHLTSEHGYCPHGYQIHANPKIRTGTYGYSWFIECND